jgi:regulation of enolase protein 1 (concanavalin A-like superfamily)
LVNGTQWSVEGQLDGALQFDGVDDNVSLPIGSVIEQLSDSTFAIWVNWVTIGAPTQRIFDFGTGEDSYMYLTPGDAGGGGAIQFSITTSGGSAETQLIAPFALAAGWHHLAVVMNSVNQNMQLYLDGDLVVTGSTQILPADLGNTTQNWLGRSQADAYTWLTGSLDDFRIYNKALTSNEIARVITGDPALASKPRPANGATVDIEHATPINWLPGESAAQHDVYFGTDANAVENADISDTTGIYRGRQDPNNYAPLEELIPNQTYYWRIDEVNADAIIIKGNLWSFTVSEYLIVDDFEEYGDVENRIFDVWTDFFVNNTGMTVGHFDPPFAEQDIVHGGAQSMYMRYDNDGTVNEGTDYEQSGTQLYSEAEREWPQSQDWTRRGANSLTLWFRGVPASVGSFTEGPPITMTAGGADIWGTADEFHFAYKRLSGGGSITAKVLSVSNTDPWAKAGVMIRESLNTGSVNVMIAVTPGNGVTFQSRNSTDADSVSTVQADITAPQWVRLTRSGNTFTGEYSADGSNWTTLTSADIPMLPDTYIGLCVTSHNVDATCTAEFSDVTTSSSVTGEWQSQDIGIESNMAEQLYVVLQDSAGSSAVVKHPDPAATTIGTWIQWNIPLTDFAGVNMQVVTKMSIGVGDRANQQFGSAGDLYIDDIWLVLPRPEN